MRRLILPFAFLCPFVLFSQNDFETLLDSAYSLVKTGHFDSASLLYSAAMDQAESDSQISQIYILVGNMNGLSGELVKSKASFKKAIELNPDDPQAYLSLIDIFGEMGQIDSISHYYNIVSTKELAGRDSDRLSVINANLLLIDGETEKAKSFLKEWEPHSDHYKGYKYFLLYSASGTFTEQTEYLKRGIEIFKKSGVNYDIHQGYKLLIEAYHERHKSGKAINLNKYISYRDSLQEYSDKVYNDKFISSRETVENEMKLKIKDLEVQRIESEKLAAIKNNWLLSGLLVIFIIASKLFYDLQKKKRKLESLELQQMINEFMDNTVLDPGSSYHEISEAYKKKYPDRFNQIPESMKPDDIHLVILMDKDLGLTKKQIAQYTNRTHGAIRTAISRLKNKYPDLN